MTECWDAEGSGQSWLNRLSKQRIYSLGWDVLRRKNISDISRLILKEEELIIWFSNSVWFVLISSCLQMYSDSHAFSQSVCLKRCSTGQKWCQMHERDWNGCSRFTFPHSFNELIWIQICYPDELQWYTVCITSRVSIHLFLFWDTNTKWKY